MKAYRRFARICSGLKTAALSVVLVLSVAACDSGCERSTGSGLAGDESAEELGFEARIKKIRQGQKWDGRKDAITSEIPKNSADLRRYMSPKTSRELLLRSFEMGKKFLLKYQNPEGNFKYQYDWLTKTWKKDDNQVRQTGALWGLALCHRRSPAAETDAGVKKGFEYWFAQTVPGPQNTLTVKYKSDVNTSSGTVALLGLAIIEYLLTEQEIPADYKAELESNLKGYLGFLQWMQKENGHFAKSYSLSKHTKSEISSPYFDGETLLCLCKAARYLGHEELVPTIEKAARATAETYTVKAWAKDEDSKETKGFYQWGSMAFVEYYEAKWKDHELFADITLALSWWMIHTHRTLTRSLNTAYALEGLISAYRIAKYRKDTKAMVDLFYVIDRMFYKLTSWQINGPLAHENEFLQKNPTTDEWATGGVMNKAKPASKPQATTTYHELRVDVTQHQMHAVILALGHVYPNG